MKILFIIYDNESANNPIPLGVLYIASYIRKHEYTDITFYNKDVYHYPNEHLTQYLDNNKFDIIGLGFVAGYHQHKQILQICDAINKSKNRPFVVLGGTGPSPVPEFYLEKTKADAVVVGEGELTFLNILKDFEAGKSINNVRRDDIIHDLTEIPFPAYDLVPTEYYLKSKIDAYLVKPTDRFLTMITGRSCPYSCNFCYNIEPELRIRPMEDVVEEIKKYIKDYNVTYIAFWDELFMLSEKRINEFYELIKKNNINIRYWCTGRFNIVNKNILKMLKETGCQIIDYGIEQFDNYALEQMNKKLTEEQIVKGIELTQEYGINIAFNIIFGNIGDTKNSLKKSLDLLHKYNDYGQLRVIRPVTPYPGTKLYEIALSRGLIKDAEDFYNKHVNVELPACNFTNIPDKEFIDLLYEANMEIIDKYYKHQAKLLKQDFKEVYYGENKSFRGGRH